ncbi:endoribonuclease Dicer-like [Lytechinus pictus]|uniref:endoribonuclease Dicer-like n=1 Tax=Lytechinus pictus TaxID=7653 RepID=UPI0030BA13F6
MEEPSPLSLGLEVIDAETPGSSFVTSQKEFTPILSFTPRQYQLELLETALEQNTVVYLQSGTEKTFLAVMLIKELSWSVRMPVKDGGKRSIFLVNSESYLSKCGNVIHTHTDLDVKEYRNREEMSSWDKTKWQDEIEHCHVAVMDSEIFLKLLQMSFVDLSMFNLLILDEFHHTLNYLHPYHHVMLTLRTCPREDCPRILGLSESVLKMDFKPVALEKQIELIEENLKCKAKIATNLTSISKYGTKPKEAVIVCRKYGDCVELVSKLSQLLTGSLKQLNQFEYSFKAKDFDGELVDCNRDPVLPAKQALTECLSALMTIGPLGVKILIPMLVRELLKLERHEFLDVHLLFLQHAVTQLRMVERICDNALREGGNFYNLKFLTPRVRRLLEILAEFKPKEASPEEKAQQSASRERTNKFASRRKAHRSHKDMKNPRWRPVVPEDQDEDEASDEEEEEEEDGPDADIQQTGRSTTNLCGIVFVEHRYTAAVMSRLFKKLSKRDPRLHFLLCSCIAIGSGRLGVAKKSAVQAQNQRRKNEEVLRKFRRREVNVLVATSSVEDGVELPRCNGCNLVVRFDRPTSYQSYMQSKAKARAPTSHFLMLIDEPDVPPFLKDVQSYQEFERVLNRKSRSKIQQKEEEVDLLLADQQMPAYVPKNEEGSPRASMTTAIQIINRYCAKLPSDVFTHLTASCKIEERKGEVSPEFQATLQLPINSPIREPIRGQWMKRKKWATMAVAVKTAEILHKAGQLNDFLQPIGKESVLKVTENAYNHLFAEGQTRPGTTKKRQYYDKEVAKCLQGCLPRPDEPCYLYSIDMSLASPLPDILNIRERKLHRPEETHQCFGILTSKQIPKVPGFPVYTRAGELAVTIKLQSDAKRLSGNQIRRAQSFHGCMFSEVLRLDKPNLELNPEKSQASYLIVPLKEGPDSGPSVIDWSFLEEVSLSSGHLDQPPQLPDYSQSQFEFSTDILANAVVTPIYRNIDQPQRYFVADILYDLPVTSPFPSEKYETFVDYYFERYDIQISNFQQPLVDVDCMSSRLNLLTPRYLNHKGKALPISTGQNKKGNLQKKQYLVPELCYIYPIPASLWRKAVCLPSILYRLNALLIAEELRVQVAEEAGIGLKKLPEEYPYPNLSFGWEGLDLEALERQEKEAKEAARCDLDEGNAIYVEPKCNNYKQLKENERAAESELQTSQIKDVEMNEQLNTPCDQSRLERSRRDGNMNSTNENKETFDDGKFHLDDDGYDPQKCLGPSPTIILQSLTMSNSSDGFNLERLEMLGDSFLKQAVTVYLYCSYPHLDEGKLSFLRSKQVSNFNLYCLGEKKKLAHKMQVSLFDPSINWLPPCLLVKESSKPVIKEENETDQDAGFVIDTWDPSTVEGIDDFDDDDFDSDQGWEENSDDISEEEIDETKAECPDDFFAREEKDEEQWSFSVGDPDDVPGLTYTGAKTQDVGSVPPLPYEIHTQHSMSDKSIADCVEALIGCYLMSCGFRSALLLMAWMGLDVLPTMEGHSKKQDDQLSNHSSNPAADLPVSCRYGYLKQPESPLSRSVPDAKKVLKEQLVGYEHFEKTINYRFKDRAYLLQAFTHSSYHRNSITDCYQRLEFLGDALLDYLITRHLYDHHTNLSPGALTDLRSALVNNTIFASLAVKFNFHKYFKAYTANMFQVIDNFVTFVDAKNEALGMDSQLKYSDGEEDESEDIEVPKALGDIFESVAGAIYLDSGMSLNAVWKVYYPMMKQQIEQYASDLPISPVRELLEMEPETARFGPPEKTIDGKTRVTVNVVGKGQFKGIGRNYHIAKATAARFALRHLKSHPQN